MGRKNLAWLTCLVRCHGFGNDRDCMPPSTRASGAPSRTLLLPSIPCYQASATQRCQSQLHRVKVGDHERCPLGAGSWVQATCTDNGVRSQPDSAPKTSPNQDRGGPFRGTRSLCIPFPGSQKSALGSPPPQRVEMQGVTVSYCGGFCSRTAN